MVYNRILDEDISQGLRVLMRVDLNISDVKDADNLRISRLIPELNRYSSAGAKLILISHFGRPKGVDENYSIKELSITLEKALKRKVTFVHHDNDISETIHEIEKMNDGDILLLENIRFYSEELNNNETFARKLAGLADIYVNNAFSVCHRNHASVSKITEFIPSFAGELLLSEIDLLDSHANVKTTLVLGGIKWETKKSVISAMEENLEYVLLGSGYVRQSQKIESEFKEDHIVIPSDLRIRCEETQCIKLAQNIVESDEIVDIGIQASRIFRRILHRANFIVWNGPLGRFEDSDGKDGSIGLVNVLKTVDCDVLIGGGDTITFLREMGELDSFKYISLGGGAMLSYLSKQKMPGLRSLRKNGV